MATHTLTPLRAAEILLVEDDPGDALLTRKALERGPIKFVLKVVETGEEAIAYLGDPRAVPPDLILLDLNLPGMHGRDVLREVKQHETWRRIPVVVLTSSKAEEDILKSYNLYCNSYMKKPGDPSIFERLAASLEEYWFVSTLLPTR
jgi:two-component system response regulator